ncbi:hypothetical protein JHW43_008426 [Diplocarpon mali]|nr:hypothetical protein JHW43_008426 [Diplocarpon mali]
MGPGRIESKGQTSSRRPDLGSGKEVETAAFWLRTAPTPDTPGQMWGGGIDAAIVNASVSGVRGAWATAGHILRQTIQQPTPKGPWGISWFRSPAPIYIWHFSSEQRTSVDILPSDSSRVQTMLVTRTVDYVLSTGGSSSTRHIGSARSSARDEELPRHAHRHRHPTSDQLDFCFRVLGHIEAGSVAEGAQSPYCGRRLSVHQSTRAPEHQSANS